MRIPHEAMVYYLGPDYGKMKIPEALKILREEKGLDLPVGITMAEMFNLVEMAYAKATSSKKEEINGR
jgi:hypothetical protein